MATLTSIPTNAVPCIANALLNFRTSTDFNADHGAKNCVLNFANNKASGTDGSEAWCSSILDKNQWIMFSSPIAREYTHFSIQGRGEFPQWVTSFYIKYSLDNVTWTDYNNKQMFSGNTDQQTVITYAFQKPILARSVAIHVESWNSHISMRCELYSKPLLPQSFVQTGTVAIGNRDINTGTGSRSTTRKVTFPQLFSMVPKVVIGTNHTDTSHDNGQTRWDVQAKNITETGFDCVFTTWGNSNVYDLRADYVAVQNI
ncbi:discoidin II [Tieghemostelium lacteum]|uniref:Discoidin II n=1 Tax=Tieghemostelium lacteum TaxID=361077 RepID=A0A151ZHJ0_TIELA|nr:discoidin II [Tieghemostelium lacteum]|eukprot:KYQ93423.1 discoidin II [Tieghemostelium lacteum]